MLCSELVSAASKCNKSVTAGFDRTLKCTLFSHYNAFVPEDVHVIPVQSCWRPRVSVELLDAGCLDQTTIINVAPGTISLASYIFCQLVESQDFYQIMFSDQTVESAALFAQDWYYLVCSCNRQKLRRSSVILFYWIFNVCNYLPLLPYFDKHRSQVRISISVICGCTLFPVVKQLEKEYDRGTTRSTAGLSSKSTYF